MSCDPSDRTLICMGAASRDQRTTRLQAGTVAPSAGRTDHQSEWDVGSSTKTTHESAGTIKDQNENEMVRFRYSLSEAGPSVGGWRKFQIGNGRELRAKVGTRPDRINQYSVHEDEGDNEGWAGQRRWQRQRSGKRSAGLDEIGMRVGPTDKPQRSGDTAVWGGNYRRALEKKGR